MKDTTHEKEYDKFGNLHATTGADEERMSLYHLSIYKNGGREGDGDKLLHKTMKKKFRLVEQDSMCPECQYSGRQVHFKSQHVRPFKLTKIVFTK